MSARIDGSEDLLRVAGSLKSSAEAGERVTYEISAALAMPSRRKLLGRWQVEEHLIAGQPYLEFFNAQQLRGAGLLQGRYSASYEFKEFLCIKKVSIDGLLPSDEGEINYEYRLTVALSWRPGQGKNLIVKPEIGYQMTMLGGKPFVCKDLPTSGEEQRITWRLEGKDLVLEEGDDRRLLRRIMQ